MRKIHENPLTSACLVSKTTAVRRAAALAIVLLAATTNIGMAADKEQGRALVQQWCKACHLADGSRTASDVAPPFGQIANDAAYTDTRLRGWLHEPHPPMPKFELDRRSINNIIAYIQSLKH